jgi:hypothetical protein
MASGREHLVGIAGDPEAVRLIVERWADGAGNECHYVDVTG